MKALVTVRLAINVEGVGRGGGGSECDAVVKKKIWKALIEYNDFLPLMLPVSPKLGKTGGKKSPFGTD